MKLLLDTNVLLLLLVGLLRADRIGGKRLEKFTSDDFRRVLEWAAEYPKHISLPNILTEASNFLGDSKQELVKGGQGALAKYIATLEEVYVPSLDVVWGAAYGAIGLTDAAILYLADFKICVVSVDYNLCNRLALEGVEVRNPFNFR